MKKKKQSNNSKIIPFPNLEDRLLNNGMEALKEKKYKDALQFFYQFTAFNQSYPEVQIGIVVCLLELGLYEDAKEKCERLLQEDIGDYFNVMQIYITILIQLSEYDQVVTLLEALFEEEKVPPEHAGELFHLLEFSRKGSDHLYGPSSQIESSVNIQALGHILESGNISEQLQAIQNLRKETTLSEITELLKNLLGNRNTHPVVQSMVLQLMIEKEIHESVIVQKFDWTMKLDLDEVVEVYEQPFTIQVLNKLEDILIHENPTLFEAVKELWERFLFVLFPFQPEPLDVMIWAGALHKFGYQLFGITVADEEIEDIYQNEIDRIDQACQQIFEVEKLSMIGH
ncbi:MAG TPA: tetratricopeptide repeat protein [Bacillales bacterium]|nr:tetratricopeptide repeat protein [Bacillales bacterium]